MSAYHPIFRDGRVHVCEQECPTCVFRPGNLMKLHPGRLKGMVDGARRDGSTIVCHETLEDWDGHGEKPAACHGFYKRFATQPLQVAERMGLIEWATPDPPASQ